MIDLFADDATLSSSDPSIPKLTNCLNKDLKFSRTGVSEIIW